MSPTLPFRCAIDPKDFGLWDARKDTFRELFLAKRKTLAQVKTTMEENGFPVFGVKTYEVVFREHFKFRKNLEAGQWLLVDKVLKKWKSQGIECVVSLSGIEQDHRLVYKKIRRERVESARNKLKYRKPQRLPEAVDIIPQVNSTLLVVGSTPPYTIDLLKPLLSSAQERKPASPTLFDLMSPSDPRLSPQQLLHDAFFVGLQMGFVDYILHNPISKVYETLGKNVPSRELINFLRGLWENTRQSPRDRIFQSEVLCGLINLSKNMRPLENPRLPYPRLFGLNDSFSVLETACSSFSNGHIHFWNQQRLMPIRQWMGTIADIGALQQFFSIPNPAVAATWVNFIWTFYHDQNAYSILVEVALRVHRGRWIRRNRGNFLANAILHGAQSPAERILDDWQVSADPAESLRFSTSWHEFFLATSKSGDLASIELLIRLSAKFHIPGHILDALLAPLFWNLGSSQAAAVHWLIEKGTKIQPAILHWIPPCSQQLPPEWKPTWDPEPLTPEDLGEMFSGDEAPKPSCRNIFETCVPLLGILALARGGQEPSRRLMSSLSTEGPSGRQRLLRLALTETTRQHNAKSTKMLLETGVLIKMEPFRKCRSKPDFQHNQDPILQAVVNTDLEMLELLFNHRLFEDYSISDTLQAMSYHCHSDRELTDLRPAVDLLLEREGSSLRVIWDDVSDSAYTLSQELVLDYVRRRINQPRTSYLDSRNLLCTLFPNDTLRETIRHGFGIDVIESLVAAGLPIPSDPTENGNTLLIDALLTRSKDRYQIVHFLLENGGDPLISSSNFTVLEATLSIRNDAWGRYFDIDDDDKVTLDLFRELSQLGAPFKRETAPMTAPCLPLLALLIQNCASIPFLETAVAAGAQVNEYGRMPPWSPLSTAVHERQLATVKWLLEQGADINARPSPESVEPASLHTTWTALEYAVLSGEMEMTILLLSHGAIINASSELPNSDHKYRRLYTAVDLATRYGRLDILKVLVDSGGLSAYHGQSGLDGAFWVADESDQTGIIVFLEQHTGKSVESILLPMREKLESGKKWYRKGGSGQLAQ